jgi:hypothetical protein
MRAPVKLSLGLAVLAALAFAVAGCGASGPSPVTVTGIPYGTITVPNARVGSLFRCRAGQSLRVLNGGFEGHASPNGSEGGVSLRRRGGKVLISCGRRR